MEVDGKSGWHELGQHRPVQHMTGLRLRPGVEGV